MDEYTDNVTAPPPSWFRRLLSVVLIVAILGGAGYGAYYMMTHRPQAKRRPPPPSSTLVEVVPVTSGTHEVVIEAMGTVVPATSISLASRVGGEIEYVAPEFVPGGRFAAGAEILRIDRADYELVVHQRQATLHQREAEQRQAASAIKQREAEIARAEAQVAEAETQVQNAQAGIDSAQALVEQRQGEVIRAQSNVRIEQGQQAVSRKEYTLLGESLEDADRELVLREPQLASVEAQVRVAQAQERAAEAQKRAAEAQKKAAEAGKVAAERALEAARIARESAVAALASMDAAVQAATSQLAEAELDLERTTLQAPFAAVVRDRQANLGSQVNAGSAVATLVGTDAFWIEVTVPVDDLRWLAIPGYNADAGGSAEIRDDHGWPADVTRVGTVARLMTDLEPSGRLARLLVSVADPLGLQGQAPALILGSYVQAKLHGRALPDVVRVPRDAVHDGHYVWIMSPEKVLDIRAVRIAWSDREAVYVREGLTVGENLVVSDIGTPVAGLELRLRGATPPATAPGRGKGAGQ